MSIGKLEVVPIREAFRHEAHNFTVWLETNIDALAQRLNMQLTVVAREKSVGSFNVDLLCENSDGEPVIVENQLERSDHDHLGKLLTYLVNLEAKTAIWITTEPRPEHQRVVDWLNESTGTDFAFYLVRVEAVRIGDSPFAPLFTVLVAPDEQTREIGETKKELADRHHLRLEFWTTLLERSRTRTHLFSNKTPSHDYWLGIGSGRVGIEFNYLILKDGAGIDLVIDVGDYDKNKILFDRLYAQKDEIEAEFGDALEWRRLDNKRTSRIVKLIKGHGNSRDCESWEMLQDLMIDMMIRFDKTLRPRIAALK